MNDKLLIEGYNVKIEKKGKIYEALIEDLKLKVEVKKKEDVEAAVITALNKYFRELYSLPEKKSRLKFFKIKRMIEKNKQRNTYGKKGSNTS
ncbi:MAG: hypothetical protein QXF35_01055 [Candidatus Bilamarchaeaceae archaeon]